MDLIVRLLTHYGKLPYKVVSVAIVFMNEFRNQRMVGSEKASFDVWSKEMTAKKNGQLTQGIRNQTVINRKNAMMALMALILTLLNKVKQV